MWRALRHDLGAKITSLVVALLLWAVVAGQREVTRQITVPLVLPELPADLMYRIAPPRSARITVQATARRLIWFRFKAPQLALHFPLESTEGPVNVALQRELLKLPRQFSGRVVDIQPAAVSLQLVAVAEAELPVRVVVGREPRHPYRLASPPLPRPERVLAKGPRDRILHMPWVRTQPLDLSNEQEPGMRELALESPDSLTRFEPATVMVDYQILEWRAP